MVYRITGGIAFLFMGLAALSAVAVPEAVVGVCLLVAGIALLAGQ